MLNATNERERVRRGGISYADFKNFRRDVLVLIVGRGLRLAGLGVLLGLAGAWGVTCLIGTLLYNVTPTDPVSFGGAALFLTIVAMLASYIPAPRAMAVGPIVALRDQ